MRCQLVFAVFFLFMPLESFAELSCKQEAEKIMHHLELARADEAASSLDLAHESIPDPEDVRAEITRDLEVIFRETGYPLDSAPASGDHPQFPAIYFKAGNNPEFSQHLKELWFDADTSYEGRIIITLGFALNEPTCKLRAVGFSLPDDRSDHERRTAEIMSIIMREKSEN